MAAVAADLPSYMANKEIWHAEFMADADADAAIRQTKYKFLEKAYLKLALSLEPPSMVAGEWLVVGLEYDSYGDYLLGEDAKLANLFKTS